MLSSVSTTYRLVQFSVFRRTMSSILPPSKIPVMTTVSSFREWRRKAYNENKTVGLVATMGALHEGHLSLVRRSIAENDLTAISIFVNPAQFAPQEDLSTYPRTLPRDLELLTTPSLLFPDRITSETTNTRIPDIVFLPTANEMYPSGISQDIAAQKGTFVEVKGYGEQMEGKSRPTFFRGVATVVTKLFNAIEPSNSYFGQKDIQQALLLRRLCKDLLLSHPTPDHVHIVPTSRDPSDGLALSSRNAYLSSEERGVAGTLRSALKAAEKAWMDGYAKEACIRSGVEVVEAKKAEISRQNLGVVMQLDYLEMNNSKDFVIVDAKVSRDTREGNDSPGILSGAMWVGKTRLIDNIILGDLNTLPK